MSRCTGPHPALPTESNYSIVQLYVVFFFHKELWGPRGYEVSLCPWLLIEGGGRSFTNLSCWLYLLANLKRIQ